MCVSVCGVVVVFFFNRRGQLYAKHSGPCSVFHGGALQVKNSAKSLASEPYILSSHGVNILGACHGCVQTPFTAKAPSLLSVS